MSDDFDYDRLAILRWSDPDEDAVFHHRKTFEGSLRLAVVQFALLSKAEQADATIAFAPEPGDWSETVLEARDIRRLSKGRVAASARGLFAAVERRRRAALDRYSVHAEHRPGRLRIRSTG
ncbi:hypothetical protein [Amorphus sp. MBR-141]